MADGRQPGIPLPVPAGVPACILACVLAAVPVGCSMLQQEPLDPPVITLRGLEPEAFGFNSQVLKARLGLFNPNAVALDVTAGKLELELSGVHSATARTLAPFSVPPGGEIEVDVRVSMNLLRDGVALLQALSSGLAAERLDYRLSGYVDVKRHGLDRVPVSSAGTLVIPPASAEGRAAP